jgi:hypothetical protein
MPPAWSAFAVRSPELPARATVIPAAEFALRCVLPISMSGAVTAGLAGGELTSGVPDRKEGYYFGEELPPDPRPMHGPNLWPQHPAGLRDAVTEWMTAMTDLGQQLLRSMAQGLGLPAEFFEHNLTAAPTPLFRIFRYPPHPAGDVATWGVGEHTDYGLLTLLATDGTPGLQVHSYGEWIDAPADPDLVICNLGDMLDRLTGGRYRSNPHRVRNHAGADRYSLPFFWTRLACLVRRSSSRPVAVPLDPAARWDKANLREIAAPTAMAQRQGRQGLPRSGHRHRLARR